MSPKIQNMIENTNLTSYQIRAARAILRWNQSDLADKCGVSIPTIKRMEAMEDVVKGNRTTIFAIERIFTDAGIEFIPENGGGAGVRLKK